MTASIIPLKLGDDAETVVDIFRAAKSAKVNIISSVHLLRKTDCSTTFYSIFCRLLRLVQLAQ
jgi:hypothetical protein